MGRARNQRANPQIVQDGQIIPLEQLQAFSAKYAIEAVLRYSEALGKGPRMTRASSPDSVDIMWHWSPTPKGLPEEDLTADFTLRIQYFQEPIGKVSLFHFFSPYCPDVEKKNQTCKDARELLIIELTQKGLVKTKEGQ